MENRQITIKEVAEDVGISVGSCHAIFSDILGLKRVAAKFVTRQCLFIIFKCIISEGDYFEGDNIEIHE